MNQEETETRIKFLEKATNRLAENAMKSGKGKGSLPREVIRKAVQIPAGGIRIKLPAYDVHYMGNMRRVDVAALESDPDLYAHMRTMHPTIFVE